MTANEIPVIKGDVKGSFAWRVLRERHPALISQIRDAHPYTPRQLRALDKLRDEVTVGRIALPPNSKEELCWYPGENDNVGERIEAVPFLWAESYFYHRILAAVEYFTSGPWSGLDPFGYLKAAELSDPASAVAPAAYQQVIHLTGQQRSRAVLLASLWANTHDLGFRVGLEAHAVDADRATSLVADDSAELLATLQQAPVARLCLVTDNAGRELVADLVLVDHLVEVGLVNEVSLHVKPHPYYVSDAVGADVIASLRKLSAGHEGVAQIARRLRSGMREDRIRLYTHRFYCAPLTFHQLPSDLAAELGSASLVLLKGDLNYRRLVGDRPWSPTQSFAELTSYFPSPVAALRTLKSDVVVGLDGSIVTALDETGRAWRTDGRHGLIQARL